MAPRSRLLPSLLFLICAPAWVPLAAHAATCPCSAWSSSATPKNPSENDPNAVEVGVKFKVDECRIHLQRPLLQGCRQYGDPCRQPLDPRRTVARDGDLYERDRDGLAAGEFLYSRLDRRQYRLRRLVLCAQRGLRRRCRFFASSGVDNPPVHLLQDGVSGGDGVYNYSATSTFPNSTFQSTNYWVDVVFTPSSATLGVTTITPAIGQTGVGSLTTVSATFSNTLNAATVNASTFTLTGPGNTLIAATVSATGNTATLAPTSPLAGSTTYSATLTTGIKDVSGNALAANYTWAFTTGALAAACASPPNAIEAENCLTGTPQCTWDISGGDAP